MCQVHSCLRTAPDKTELCCFVVGSLASKPFTNMLFARHPVLFQSPTSNSELLSVTQDQLTNEPEPRAAQELSEDVATESGLVQRTKPEALFVCTRHLSCQCPHCSYTHAPFSYTLGPKTTKWVAQDKGKHTKNQKVAEDELSFLLGCWTSVNDID